MGGLEGLSDLDVSLGFCVVRGDRGDGRGGSLGVSLGAGPAANHSDPSGSVGNNVGGRSTAVHQNSLSNGNAFGSQNPVDFG